MVCIVFGLEHLLPLLIPRSIIPLDNLNSTLVVNHSIIKSLKLELYVRPQAHSNLHYSEYVNVILSVFFMLQTNEGKEESIGAKYEGN